MRSLKDIPLFFWSLWCGLTFLLAMIIMLPILMGVVAIGNQKLIRQAHYWPPFLARIILVLWGIRIEVKNKELIKPDMQLVYISNHMSYLDALIAGSVIPNFVKFLGKAEILNWPGLGFLLKHFYVAVQRDDKNNRAWSMDQMNEKVKTGASFFICPEGTCNTTENLLKTFYDGAYKLAIGNKIPIVPLTFIGAGDLMPRDSIIIRPGKIVVYWSEPIDTSNMAMDDIPALKKQTTDIITANLLKHYPDRKYEVKKYWI
jgi:1-acyl-sn-glycerol-3-phosphate acyltransferase